MTPRFASVILDVDSTLSGIEGIDWLAAHRSDALRVRVTKLTDDAMSGRVTLDSVYRERLDAVAPTLAECQTLGLAYRMKVAPGAADTVRAFLDAGVRVAVVSGGLYEAILPLAESLGIDEADVHAVRTFHDERGYYDGYDLRTALATESGKVTMAQLIALPRPLLAVGDGSTDLAMRTAGEADAFAAFTGFITRDAVVAGADHVVSSFAELRALVLGDAS
ncbi:MAG: HAD-IB family phosphatase [Gemmatimonadetes bacterium]|nr:HAD-IB family phosphatase [Gemmatimonadota bacterium]